jgi:predicted methyltransferase
MMKWRDLLKGDCPRRDAHSLHFAQPRSHHKICKVIERKSAFKRILSDLVPAEQGVGVVDQYVDACLLSSDLGATRFIPANIVRSA